MGIDKLPGPPVDARIDVIFPKCNMFKVEEQRNQISSSISQEEVYAGSVSLPECRAMNRLPCCVLAAWVPNPKKEDAHKQPCATP
jgi:hypothetical protein